MLFYLAAALSQPHWLGERHSEHQKSSSKSVWKLLPTAVPTSNEQMMAPGLTSNDSSNVSGAVANTSERATRDGSVAPCPDNPADTEQLTARNISSAQPSSAPTWLTNLAAAAKKKGSSYGHVALALLVALVLAVGAAATFFLQKLSLAAQMEALKEQLTEEKLHHATDRRNSKLALTSRQKMLASERWNSKLVAERLKNGTMTPAEAADILEKADAQLVAQLHEERERVEAEHFSEEAERLAQEEEDLAKAGESALKEARVKGEELANTMYGQLLSGKVPKGKISPPGPYKLVTVDRAVLVAARLRVHRSGSESKHTYKIDLSKLEGRLKAESDSGTLSPITDVTLSAADLEVLRLPKTTVQFCFGQPLKDAEVATADLSNPLLTALCFGFFMYFDVQGEPIAMCALGRGDGLYFNGPFRLWTVDPSDKSKGARMREFLLRTGRVSKVNSSYFKSWGAREFAWLNPSETMDTFDTEQASLTWPHGALVYLFDQQQSDKDSYFRVIGAPQEAVDVAQKEQQTMSRSGALLAKQAALQAASGDTSGVVDSLVRHDSLAH